MVAREHRHLRARVAAQIGLLAMAFAPARAQHVPPADNARYARAIAAGYKALTYCNGIFAAGRIPAQIDTDELAGIYPEYDALVPTLKATVNPYGATVYVDFDDLLSPRSASWWPQTGCTLGPIGGQPQPSHEYLLPGVKPPAAPTEPRWGGKSGRDMPPLLLDYDPPWAAPAPGGPDSRPWPMGDARIRPAPKSRLGAAVGHAFEGGYGIGVKTIGVVVVLDGKLVAERYGSGWGPFTSNRTWSAAKSLAGTLVGLASAETPGKLDVKAPASISQWQGRDPMDERRRIKLDHLLRMTSGLHTDSAGNRTDAIYFGGTAVDEQAVGSPLEAEPGRRFRYANDDILLAMMAVRQAIDDPAYTMLPTKLFAALGMTHTQAGVDPHGNYILSSQVWSTARDLARLGQFWLQDGVWQGQRLLPEGWVKYMTTPSGPQPADGPGYGATMWLFGPKQGLPAGSFAAIGNRGQYVMVVPSEHLVVVRRGEDPGAARFDIARFTADVIAAAR